jgi:prolycopene isomerase
LLQTNRYKSDYDVIVVGSGMGGLTSALELANHGVSVLVLEKHNMTGGYATSFVRGRYEFEASIHELCECGDNKDGRNLGGVRKILNDCGVYPEFKLVPEPYRVILSNHNIDFTMPYGIENAIAAIEKVDPGQGPKVRNYFKLCEEVYDALMYIADCDYHPDKMVMATKHSSFLRTAAYSVEQVHDVMGFTKLTRDLLSTYYGYVTRRLSETSFTVWALMLYIYIHDGGYIIDKTSHALAVDIEERIRELGGQIETNVAVVRLIAEKGAVVGVKTAMGEEIRAKRVLCNLAPDTVYTKMLDKKDVPERALKLTGARTPGAALFGVYMGLNALPKDMGIESYEVFVNDDLDQERIYRDSKKWQVPAKFSVTCPDVAIPGLTGPDRCQINFTMLLDPEAMVGHTDPLHYMEDKERFANELINQYEKKTGARIREHIEEIEVATPATFHRYGSNPKGNTYCYEMSVVDGIVPRMLALEEEQFIPGLDFVGAYGRRALGYSCSITNGHDTAMDTLKKLGR